MTHNFNLINGSGLIRSLQEESFSNNLININDEFSGKFSGEIKTAITAISQDEKILTENSDSGRVYVIDNEIRFPSITTVLGAQENNALESWKSRVGEQKAQQISERAASRGTRFHDLLDNIFNHIIKTTNNLDTGFTTIFSCMNIIEKNNFISAVEKLFSHMTAYYCHEFSLVSYDIGLAGRVDCVCDWNGIPAILDFKTSSRPKNSEWISSYYIQETAYAYMFQEMYNIPISLLVTFILCDDGQIQIFHEKPKNWISDLDRNMRNFHKKKQDLYKSQKLHYGLFYK